MDPRETLRVLNRLNEISSKSKDLDAMERNNVELLIDTSKYSEPKCARSYFHALNTMIARNDAYQHTIYPFLRHHMRELFRFCQPNYEAKAKLDLSGLDTETAKGVKQLRQSVIIANSGKVEKLYDDYSQEAIVRGIYHYLRVQADQESAVRESMAKKTINKQDYAQFAKTHLREYCNKYTMSFQPKISPSDYKIFNDDGLLKIIDPHQYDNLVELRICLQIKPKLDQLIDQAFELVKGDRR